MWRPKLIKAFLICSYAFAGSFGHIIQDCSAAESNLTVVASFAGTNGALPWANVVQGTDGNFYGTTFSGGVSSNYSLLSSEPAGTVFKASLDGNLTSLVAFVGTNGSHPRAGLIEGLDGNFYGTTHEGGADPEYGAFGTSASPGLGTVFRITTNGDLTTLVSFWGTNGAHPAAGLVMGADGNMYGTTRLGGSSFGDPHSPGSFGWGEVFRVTTNGEFTIIQSFPGTLGTNNPGSPMTPLILGPNGNLFGNMFGGSFGLVFQMTPQGFATPLALLNQTNGFSHLSALCESRDGGFYGVSHLSGTYQHGGLWRVLPDGSQTTICSFANAGSFPWGGVVEGTDGRVYGTRSADQENPNGLVYSVSPDGIYQTIAAFNGTNGANPMCALIQGLDGNFYGTASGGGAYAGPFGSGLGVIFKLNVASARAPRLRLPSGVNNQVTLKWSAIANRKYQPQYKSSLDQVEWNNLGDAVRATNSLGVTSDTVGSRSQRFYQVLLLP